MLLLAMFSSILISCKKEESVPFEEERSTQLAGTYDFVGMSVDAVQTLTTKMDDDILKAVMITHYDTKNNTGTTVIAGSSIQNNNYGYRMEATSEVKYYLNGNVVDEETVTSSDTVPVSSNLLQYRLKGADSIYTTAGVPPVTQGGRYYWKGDTLIIAQRILMDVGDDTDRSVSDINTLTKLKKRK